MYEPVDHGTLCAFTGVLYEFKAFEIIKHNGNMVPMLTVT